MPRQLPPRTRIDSPASARYRDAMLARLCLVVAVVTSPGCTTTGTFEFVETTAQLGHAAVYHFHLESDDADEFQASVHGTATNRSTDQDCRIAIYTFDAAPDPADLTPLALDGLAPTQHAGGTLVAEHALPRQGERSFEVPIDDIDLGSGRFTPPAHDRWFAVIPCPDARLTLQLEFLLIVGREGYRNPEYDQPFVEQTW